MSVNNSKNYRLNDQQVVTNNSTTDELTTHKQTDIQREREREREQF
jgi:hypothetical protein